MSYVKTLFPTFKNFNAHGMHKSILPGYTLITYCGFRPDVKLKRYHPDVESLQKLEELCRPCCTSLVKLLWGIDK